jgi:hypothetical protein
VVVDRDRLKEFFSASEDSLSLKAESSSALQVEYTAMRDVSFNIPLIRKKLSHVDSQIMDDVLEELDLALTDAIHATEGMYLL